MDVPEHPPIMGLGQTTPRASRSWSVEMTFPGVVSDIENFSVVIAHGLLQPSASSAAIDLALLRAQAGNTSVTAG